MCKNGDKEFGVVGKNYPTGNWFSTKEQAEGLRKQMPEPTVIEEHQTNCGECNECSQFCDVCGLWYNNDEPCELH